MPADVLNKAQRLLLSTGGYDVEAVARDAQQLQVKVRAGVEERWWRCPSWECRLITQPS